MYTQSASYTTLYFVYKFFLGNRFRSTRTPSGPFFFLLKAHTTSNKMYALQLKIIRSQRSNIGCDTITYYGIPFTLEKCFFFKSKVLKWFFLEYMIIVCKSSLGGCLFHINPTAALYRSLITCRNSLFVHESFFCYDRSWTVGVGDVSGFTVSRSPGVSAF